MTSLNSLIADDAIDLHASADDWRGAISASGRLLENSGVATADYTRLMIESVENNGPYIVLTPGFALAHARPDPSVLRTGMSFARLAEPVAFGHEANDPVSIVMSLAATDASAHQQALAALAGVLADPARRARLDASDTIEELRSVFDEQAPPARTAPGSAEAAGETSAPGASAEDLENAVPSKNLILCVCGNGVGTSLFLKNTLEGVLTSWGWDSLIDVEATDTISAKGKAGSADLVLTSQAIADALGDVGVPVEIITDFTSQREIDHALRRWYVV
ncbi:MAG: PTS sugar transporter subunit IIA [Dermabacter sp.]|nr:PTS sugar transporter subunit IIA [Dermabacter sp.]